MAASDHLNRRQFMYHDSPATNRESIQQAGLRAHSPYDPSYHHGPEEAPKGVYMHSAADLSTQPGADIWKVDVTGLKLHTDPDFMGAMDFGSKYHPHDIEAGRVKLHGGA